MEKIKILRGIFTEILLIRERGVTEHNQGKADSFFIKRKSTEKKIVKNIDNKIKKK